jgi:hypothetical protein
MIDRLRQQVGRLDIVSEELEGRNQRSAVFKTMFLAFRSIGAKDWRSKLAIALDHSGSQHKLQFHHIFISRIRFHLLLPGGFDLRAMPISAQDKPQRGLFDGLRRHHQ